MTRAGSLKSTDMAKDDSKVKVISNLNPDELIFSLDIGTRTVIGVVGIKNGDSYDILDIELLEHKSRSMLDGQIHNIDEVAHTAKNVKETLENRIGIKLNKVAIAAAGRVLKTCQMHIEKDITEGMSIDTQQIMAMEMEAIQLAQQKLEKDILKVKNSQYYCVGYSVVNYYLNEYVIQSLVNHKGQKMGADILATFLPHMVVDSLYTVMDKIELEVANLTLEPIAALNVAIPQDLRLLNLALVDIGAGTSDIAITKDGTVTAYAMVPFAGDEITEAIAKTYLVDFYTAENIKIQLSSKKQKITFKDILDNENEVTISEINTVIKPIVMELAQGICDRIIEYNVKPPNAVFLIGGGSQISLLPECIAEILGLPLQRVAVRNRNVAKSIKYSGDKLSGPESITPFGILVTADMNKGKDFMTVTINDKPVKLYNSRKLTVSDALTLIGYNAEKLMGRSGKSLIYYLNDERKTVRGGFGQPAEIMVNGKMANLGTVLTFNDEITVKDAIKGEDAQANLHDIINPISTISFLLNGSKVEIPKKVIVNGELIQTNNLEIEDNTRIDIDEYILVDELAQNYEIDMDMFDIFINGKKADKGQHIKENDKVDLQPKKKQEKEQFTNIDIVNDNVINVIDKVDNKDINKNKIEINVNGKPIIIEGDKQDFMFVDIFNFIDFDLSKPKGIIKLIHNGKKAGFTDKIHKGDIIEIYWD